MDLNLTERVSKQRSFSFPLRGWSLLNVVLLVLAELQASEFKFSRNGKRTLKNPSHRLITRVFRDELDLYPLEFSGLSSLEVGVV